MAQAQCVPFSSAGLARHPKINQSNCEIRIPRNLISNQPTFFVGHTQSRVFFVIPTRINLDERIVRSSMLAILTLTPGVTYLERLGGMKQAHAQLNVKIVKFLHLG